MSEKECLEKSRELYRFYEERGNTNVIVDTHIRNLESELTAAREEIARLKAQPVRIVDAEKLRQAIEGLKGGAPSEVLIHRALTQTIDSLAIPAPDYMGALRTMAKVLGKRGCAGEDGYRPCTDENCHHADKEVRARCWIDYALANPTREGS